MYSASWPSLIQPRDSLGGVGSQMRYQIWLPFDSMVSTSTTIG